MTSTKKAFIENANRKNNAFFLCEGLIEDRISSKLLDITPQDFINLEIEIRSKCSLTTPEVVKKIALLWRDSIFEDINQNKFMMYIINTKEFPHKRVLMHKGLKPEYDQRKSIIFL